MYQSDVEGTRRVAGFDDERDCCLHIEIYEEASGATVASAGPFDWNAGSGEYLLTGTALQDSGVYHARVIAINGAGLINNVTTAPGTLSIDTAAPRPPVTPSWTSR